MQFTTNKIYHGAAYYPECWDKEEMDKVTQALNNNTLAIQKLTDYIESKDV